MGYCGGTNPLLCGGFEGTPIVYGYMASLHSDAIKPLGIDKDGRSAKHLNLPKAQ